jgi:hypothetical protein
MRPELTPHSLGLVADIGDDLPAIHMSPDRSALGRKASQQRVGERFAARTLLALKRSPEGWARSRDNRIHISSIDIIARWM